MFVLLAAAARTPFAPADGVLAGWHPVDLTALVMNAAVASAGVGPETVDHVLVGCAEPVGAQGADLARAAILAADWPEGIGGLVVDAGATSGSAALHLGAAMIASGQARTVVVAGVSSASTVQPGAAAMGRAYGRPWGDGPARRVADDGGLLPGPQAAERAAAHRAIDRDAQDSWAERSHILRAEFPCSAALVSTAARPGDSVAVQRGTPIGADMVRAFPGDARTLPPMFDEDGTVTGATFAPAADGATAMVLTSSATTPVAQLLGTGRSAGHPLDALGGLAESAERARTAGNLLRHAVTTWEIGETTAAAALSAIADLGIEPAWTNRRGGTLGVGDAGAAEDLRLGADGVIEAAAGEVVGTAAFGLTGSAVTVWLRL